MNDFDFTNFNTKYLVFQDATTQGRKTRIIDVRPRHHSDILGMIHWWGPWRQYVFAPCNNTVFNKGCMEDIIKVIDALMAERRKK